tara:strand:+ start:92 stop:394 length:303 start_codon:yes stop_codon:yes gene_type:complete
MKNAKSLLKILLSKLKSPFILLSFLFVLWMLFLDSNSYLSHRNLNHNIEQLEKDQVYYRAEIRKDSIALHELSNPEGLEKYAREKYHMKKKNEEIFLIEE